MAVAFSTDSSALFQVEISTPVADIDKNILSSSQLEICKTWIKNAAYQRVALQFPDEYLHLAGKCVHTLEKDIAGLHAFVLADTSYGSCCVDEIAAEHGSGDCIIHFGHSCLSPTKRLPVMYLFGEITVDVDQGCDKIIQCLSEENITNVALVYDVSVHHCIDVLYKRLQVNFPNMVLSHLNLESNAQICCGNSENTAVDKDLLSSVTCGGRTLYLPKDKSIGDYTILYIGPESMTLTNLMMTWNKSTFYRYNPLEETVKKESANVNKLLMKRYFMVEKAKDAQIVGILVGTLGVANYIQIIQKMKSLLKKAGKKYYTFVVGKLNVAKLANFMEIDVYVYISCGENTVVDSKEFYRPIVTPYEMEIACNPEQQWTGEYVMEFQQLLPGGQSYVAVPEENVEGHADVSLITGDVRHLGVKDTGSTSSSAQAVVERGDNLQLANTASEFLSNRSWRGLEQELGKTPVVKATKGRKGIAIEYENEPT